MKKKVFNAFISKRLKNIRKYCDKIEKHYKDEDIHKLRVEVKKLRAFLRMIALELKDPAKLKLPKELKAVYRIAGVVRDIHLHLKRIEEVIQHETDKPAEYFLLLKKKAAKNKKQLSKLLSQDPIASARKKITKQLPETVGLETIHTFIQQKIISIALLILSHHENDEDLHNIRKNLKDLMYDATIFDEGRKTLHPPLLNPDQLKMIDQLAQKLGDFNDLRLAATFMEPEYLNGINDSEKSRLLVVHQQWIREKVQLKQDVLQYLAEFYHSLIKKK